MKAQKFDKMNFLNLFTLLVVFEPKNGYDLKLISGRIYGHVYVEGAFSYFKKKAS